MHIVARSLTAVGASLVFAHALAATAAAQTTFTGFTNGCFYMVGDPVCSPENTNAPATDVLGALTYRNSTFNVTTVGGTAAIGNAASMPVNTDNLGSISFPAGPVSFQDFVDQRFVLNVNFTAPAGVPAGDNLWTATLTGTIEGTAGGVRLDFDNTPRLFTWDEGTFTLVVDDVSLTKNNDMTEIALSGFITATTVPEPGTYALMLTGLAGVFVVMRRRRA